MSKRNYSKRTKSTNRKTYADYIAYREEQLSKGIQLRKAMSEGQFNAVYDQYARAKRRGKIKSSPWQHLKQKERLISSRKQAKLVQKSFELISGGQNKPTLSAMYKLNEDELAAIAQFFEMTKSSELYKEVESPPAGEDE